MHLIRHLPPRADRASAIAIGNFDGLHLGHAAVIDAMHGVAQSENLIPSVLTFEPHPRRFFAPTAPAFRLLPLSGKLRGLRARGVARVIMPRFNAAFATMPAEVFLDQVLLHQLGAKAIITGENFAFGHKRGGNRAMLSAWGAAHAIRIITVPPVRVGGDICSSSAIRTAITAGRVAHAATLLGRHYTLSGRVMHGDERGRTLGYPTANIHLAPDMLLPAYGVYAVRAHMQGMVYDGVANIGIRPTIAVDKRPSLEVHLFDTVQEIYGETLEIMFVDNIRNEKKFESLEALTNQIAADAATARHLLKETR